MDAKACVDQLNAFADAWSIKEYFKTIGVKGYRQDETSCPISRWIHNTTGRATITEDNIKVFTGDYDGPYDPVYDEYETSQAVKDFIDKFDSGEDGYEVLDADDYAEGWL